MNKWKDRIKQAQEVGGFTEDDRTMAGTFDCCAISEKIDIKKFVLNRWGYTCGMAFWKAVRDNNPTKAQKIYNVIQNTLEKDLIDKIRPDNEV